MTRNIAQNTRPSFRFSEEGSGHETTQVQSGTIEKSKSPNILKKVTTEYRGRMIDCRLHACLVNYQVLSPQATVSLFLASKLPCKCNVHGAHSQINTEPFSIHDICLAFGFFYLPSTLLICCHVQRHRGLGGVVKFCLNY